MKWTEVDSYRSHYGHTKFWCAHPFWVAVQYRYSTQAPVGILGKAVTTTLEHRLRAAFKTDRAAQTTTADI